MDDRKKQSEMKNGRTVGAAPALMLAMIRMIINGRTNRRKARAFTPSRVKLDRAAGRVRKMKKSNQQSRSGWGGKRAGAGAPLGNTNAVKHGERSRQAFFTLAGAEHLPPLISLRGNNLAIAERIGELCRIFPDADPATQRELILLDGIMWQHTRRMVNLERGKVRLSLKLARLELVRAKLHLAQTKAAIRSNRNK
jgi:hypothetical protein